MHVDDLYPASPAQIPEDLTTPSTRYRLRVALALGALLLFVALYVAWVVVALRVFLGALTLDVPVRGFWSLALRVFAVAAPALFLIFLIKPVFKSSPHAAADLLEVTPRDQPDLFVFLRRLCRETGATMPLHVYVTHEVNAAVFYESSLLSLVLPVRKNLIVGLGLINHLTLSELKAVLGHEFGHFAQGSMRLGSYVYVARRAVSDVVYGRDRFDDLLATWRAQDIRIALWGWILYGLVRCVRELLVVAFKGVTLAYATLSREMELQADRVSVRVAGSEAIVRALGALARADRGMGLTLRDLALAGDHGIYTRDLFYHHARAVEVVRGGAGDDDTGVTPSMWSSHPSNEDRARNAREHAVSCAHDERPAWTLFRDAAALREQVTARLFAGDEKRTAAARDPVEVQRFLDDERAETTFDARYCGMYDGRLVAPGNLDAVVAAHLTSPLDVRALRAESGALYGPELSKVTGAVRALLGETRGLALVVSGVGASAQFRGATVRGADAQKALADVQSQLAARRAWLEALDRRVLRVHLQMAHALGAEWRDELLKRYRFQVFVQDSLVALRDARRTTAEAISPLSRRHELSAWEVDLMFGGLRRAHEAFEGVLTRAARVGLPALRNVEAGAPLRGFLLGSKLVSMSPLIGSEVLDGAWLGAFFNQMAEVADKLDRLCGKNLGGLLALQERVAQEFMARTEGRP